MSVVIDYSHVGRTVTGIERIALEVFSPEALQRDDLIYVKADGLADLVRRQWMTLPRLALSPRTSVVICPGFPPSLALCGAAGAKVLPYIHDLVLLERVEELNARARLYMRPSFRHAVATLRRFVVNSQHTADELARVAHPQAAIDLLRPVVRNVFGLSPRRPSADETADRPFRLISIGTIEPRKNYLGAMRIRQALEARSGRRTELHIVGRVGWGSDHEALAKDPQVFLHGHLPSDAVRALLHRADLYLATSLEEGLGLPLLEVQHGGLAVAAADITVFREVLAGSGLHFDAQQPAAAAEIIAASISRSGWRAHMAAAALQNVQRWNLAALRDLENFRDLLAGYAAERRGRRA